MADTAPAAPLTASPLLVASLLKGISVLDFIVAAERPIRAQDVADHFGLDRSTAYRFVTTLESAGLLTKDPHRKTYAIGPHFLRWQQAPAGNHWIAAQARPIIADLARRTGQTAHLAMLRDQNIEFIEVAPSGATIAVHQAAGDREPLYVSAVGKAILAFLPVREAQSLKHQITFKRFTETTIDSLSALDLQLAKVRKAGIAFDNGEGSPGVTCIAAPIRDARDYPIASIGISAVRGYYPGTIYQQTTWIDCIRAAAIKLSAAVAASPA